MTTETAAVSFDTLLDNIETAASDFAAAADNNADALDKIAALLVEAVPAEAEDPKSTPQYVSARNRANKGLRATFLSRPRSSDNKPLDMELCREVTEETVTDKDVKSWPKDDPRRAARKAVQGFMRTKWQRIAAVAFPVVKVEPTEAEAAEAEAAPTVTDPTAALQGITETLVALSKSNPAAAKALLNGLDSLVKSARPYIAEGKPIP